MKKAFLALILLIAFPALGAEPIGKIIDLEGESWIHHAGEKPALAFLEQQIYLADTVKTAAKGGVKILFTDDTILVVKENSNVFVSEFLFNPKAKNRKVLFQATLGKVRAIVGKFFGKDQPVEIHTPTAVAGIRGTDIGCSVQASVTTCYCFSCKLDTACLYNVRFPGKTVCLVSDQALEITKGLPASEDNIVPIPEMIQERKDDLFDIKDGHTSAIIQGESNEEGQITQKEEAPVPGPQEESFVGPPVEQPPNPGGEQQNTSGTKITITLPQ